MEDGKDDGSERKRNILVTSALGSEIDAPYVGEMVSSVLSADVFARYCRLRGHNVLFVGGTYSSNPVTKHSTPTSTTLRDCDRQNKDFFHKLHKKIYDWFGISFDAFGRTSTPEHNQLCHDVLLKLAQQGLLAPSIIHQLYCEGRDKFVADRLVQGECPHCSFPCEADKPCQQCGAIVDATQIRNPKCKFCRSPSLLARTTEHLFLQPPSALQQKLAHHCRSISISSPNAADQAFKLLSQPLPPMCITRDLDLQQGVSVPGFPDKVLPFWFDAALGYVSITKRHTSEWELWWKNPTKIELHQFIRKDDVPLHAVHLPSIMIGTQETWTLPSSINAAESFLYGTENFTKGKGGDIYCGKVTAKGFPAEAWRYYLISIKPEDSDVMFSWVDFGDKLNELFENVSNFFYGVLAFVAEPPGEGYGSIIPDASVAEAVELDVNFGATIGAFVQEYIDALEKIRLKEGLEAAMKISHVGKQYFHRNKVRNLYKEDRRRCSFVVKSLVGAIYTLACLLEPFMPSFTVKVLKQLDLPVADILFGDNIDRTRKPWDIIPSGHKIGTPRPLFNKLKTEHVEFFKRLPLRSRDNKLKDHIVSTSIKRNIERCVEAGLKRCSTAEQLKIGKEDAASSQLYERMKDGIFASTDQTLIPTKRRRVINTYTERMMQKFREGRRRVTRILSPQAKGLLKKGMSVSGIMRKLGTRSAFTNWRDGASVRVTLNRTGKRVLGVSRPGNSHCKRHRS